MMTPFRALSTLTAVAALTCAPFAHSADRVPLVGSGPTAPGGSTVVTSSTGLIVPVDPGSVSCNQSCTFEDVTGGDAPGTNYDGVLVSGGVSFAERFVGQTLSTSGDFDLVTGTPTSPLTLQVGNPGQNLDVYAYTTNVLIGLGHLGYPDLDAIGEGAISMYFPLPQSQVSMEILGGNGGEATLEFYRADGSLIDELVISGLADLSYGFATSSGEPEIVGILVQTTDPSGIGVDNICHVEGTTSSRAVTWGSIKKKYR